MLVNCVAYKNGQKLGDIERDDISEFVSQPDCFVWVALFEPDRHELDGMKTEFDLHPLAVEDARVGHQRPKIEEYGDSLFVVLHTVDVDGDEVTTGEVAIFAGSNYVLSVRRRTSRGFADVRARSEREPELLRHGSTFVLYALMDSVVDRYFPVIEKLEADLEAIEEQVFLRGQARSNLEALYGLKHRLTLVRHAAEPLREATGKLYGGRVPKLCAGAQEYFRDVYDHLERIHQSIETMRETIATAMQVNVALISLGQSEIAKKLAASAALVAVPTLIAGIYGMNFKHMPELDWTYGYPLAVAAMLGIDLVLLLKFRKTGWL